MIRPVVSSWRSASTMGRTKQKRQARAGGTSIGLVRASNQGSFVVRPDMGILMARWRGRGAHAGCAPVGAGGCVLIVIGACGHSTRADGSCSG